MSYQSPIDIIFGELQTKLEGDVLKVIQNYDIKVDKNELLKALNYDRDQYHKGWSDGWVQAKWDILKCKDCKHFQYTIRSNGWGECDLGVFGRNFVEDKWYCSQAERKDEVDNG